MLFIYLSMLVGVCQAQTLITIQLGDSPVYVQMDKDTWDDAVEKRLKSGAYVATFEKKMEKGHVATFSYKVEKVKAYTDIQRFSTAQLMSFNHLEGFKILKSFTSSDGRFSLPYTVGYEAVYWDEHKIKHHLYLLHSIQETYGISIMLDFPDEYHRLYEEEQVAILHSIQLK